MAPGQEAAKGQPHLLLLAQQHLGHGLNELVKCGINQGIQRCALTTV